MQDILIGVGYSQDILNIFPCDDGIGVSVFLKGIHHKLLVTDTKIPDVNEFIEQMTLATDAWNSASQEEREALVVGSEIRKEAILIMASLSVAGILPGQKIGSDCPFCGGHLEVNTEGLSVSHALPICERFDNTDASSFLRDVRHAEGKDPRTN